MRVVKRRARVQCPTCKHFHPIHDTGYGPRIRRLRKNQRMTLREVAEKAGVSVSFISDIEHSRRWPSYEVEYMIMGALGL